MILIGCDKCYETNDYNLFNEVIKELPEYNINIIDIIISECERRACFV